MQLRRNELKLDFNPAGIKMPETFIGSSGDQSDPGNANGRTLLDPPIERIR